MTQQYNDPNAVPSTIGAEQFNTFKWEKNALKEAKKEQYFSQMASTTNMPWM